MCANTHRGCVVNFIKCFVRDAFGAWRCVAPGTLELPTGRVQVTPGMVFVQGRRFMNVDLAALLDEQAGKPR
jgi:hypothetical protein